MRKGKDPDPDPDLDPHLWLKNPDQGGPKTYGSCESGSGTPTLLNRIHNNGWRSNPYWAEEEELSRKINNKVKRKQIRFKEIREPEKGTVVWDGFLTIFLSLLRDRIMPCFRELNAFGVLDGVPGMPRISCVRYSNNCLTSACFCQILYLVNLEGWTAKKSYQITGPS